MASFTFVTLATLFTALVAVSAAPVSIESRGKPSGWATGYLENYDTYHTRYLALSCQTKHNTTFFEDCCHPLLSTESLSSNRKAYCAPNASATISAVAAIATGGKSEAENKDSEDEYCNDSTSVAAMVSSSVAAIQATATESVTAITITSDHKTATIAVQNQIAAEAVPTTSSSSEAAWVAPTTSSTAEWVAPTTSTTPVYVAPTSTTPAYVAPVATTAAASTGGDDKTGGWATYFYQNGNPGACGEWHSDNDNIVAIDTNGYWSDYASNNNSPYCGKWVTITNTNNGKSVVAKVADACPSCTNSNSLDLSYGAFTSIASTDDGMVPISWHFNN